MLRGALEGVRIVDFTWAYAGPYTTLLLSFMGAEVIKIESLTRPDLARRMGMNPGRDRGAAHDPFNSINLNKCGIQLNLSVTGAIDLVKRLVSVSDAVAENFRPGVMDRLGLSYESLRKVNPDIVMLSLSACGATGPEASYAGYAPIFNALSGLAAISGYPGDPPTTVRSPIDLLAGSTGAFALLAGLYHRQQTGEGQHIDTSAREAISSLIGDQILEYSMNQRNPARLGNHDPVMAPHSCYKCQGEDRWVTVAVGSEKEWHVFCDATGHPEWKTDPRFADSYLRKKHETELDHLIEAWTTPQTPMQVTEKLQAVGVAAFPSLSAADMFADPHLKERGFALEVEYPESGKRVVSGPPFKLSNTPLSVRRPGPTLGQHNGYVYQELLGLSDGDYQRLAEQKVFQ